MTSIEAKFGVNAEFAFLAMHATCIALVGNTCAQFCQIKSFTNTCSVSFNDMPASDSVFVQILIE